MVLIVMLMGSVGYLAYEVSLLKDHTRVFAKLGREGVQTADVETTVAELQEGLKIQKETMEKIVGLMDSLADQVDRVAHQKFMPAPEYTLSQPYFETKETQTGYTITGNLQRVSQWLDNNELFLDTILKKVLTLDYDRARGAVVVTDLVPDSIFNQMGFKEGDAILSVNGRVMNKGAELRQALIDLEHKKIVVVRDRQRLTLDVNYANPTSNDVVLSLTKQQFNTDLPTLLGTLNLEPAYDNDTVVGVKLGQIESTSPFAQMHLQPNDVITQVNNQPATNEQLATLLRNETDSVEIEYLRDGEKGTVSVKFGE